MFIMMNILCRLGVVTLTTLLLFVPRIRSLEVCNSTSQNKCKCSENNEGMIHVDCKHKEFTNIGELEFPVSSITIDLRSNKVERLMKNDFWYLHDLEQLNLQGNNIDTVEPGAFRGLTSLQMLDLSHNKLRTIQSYTFNELVGITQLDIKRNQNLTWIAADAFYFMPNLAIIKLQRVTLDCDCQTKALTLWLKSHSIDVRSGMRSGFGQSIMDLPAEAFGNCTDPLPQACIRCNTTSLNTCMRQGTLTDCSDMDACQVTINVIYGRQHFTSRCQQSSVCIDELKDNSLSCFDGQMNQRCTFCCTGHDCTPEMNMEGYAFQTKMEITFVLHREFDPKLTDENSTEFMFLKEQIEQHMKYILGFMTMFVPEFKPELLDLSITALVEHFHPTTENLTRCMVTSTSQWPIITALSYVHQKYFQILNQYFYVQALQLVIVNGTLVITIPHVPEYCSSETISNGKGEFKWPQTLVGSIAESPCPFPAVADGVASRACILNGPDGIWEEPDLTQCTVPSDATQELKKLLELPVTNELPAIQRIEPLFGPLAGGTNITITGRDFLPQLMNIYLGENIRCNFTFGNTSLIIAQNPEVMSQENNTNLDVLIGLPHTNITSSFHFSYKADPEISSIYPLETIVSGGTTLTVEGDNFDSVAKALLKVTVWIYITEYNITSQEDKDDYYEDCKATNNTLLKCLTPELKLPEIFTNPDYIVSQSTVAKGSFTIYIGLIFDGLPDYRNISQNVELQRYGQLTLKGIPQFDDENQNFKFRQNELIGIKGKDLQNVATSDYKVEVGDGVCKIKEVTENILHCMPPQKSPRNLEHNDDDDHQILLSIGVNVRLLIGSLSYSETSTLFMILGTVSGSLILIIILTTSVLVVYRKRQKKDIGLSLNITTAAPTPTQPVFMHPDTEMIELPPIDISDED